MEYFFKAFRENLPFDETFIKELQQRLTFNTYDERRLQRRICRFAMNYLLAINNHPPLIIHQEDRKTYFEALEAWDTEQNLKPLKAFLLEQTIKTWAKRIAVLEKAEDEEDLKDFKQAMDEFKKKPKTYTHEEMKKMLNLE